MLKLTQTSLSYNVLLILMTRHTQLIKGRREAAAPVLGRNAGSQILQQSSPQNFALFPQPFLKLI